MKYVIGVYGFAATGKTTISKLLRDEFNAVFISADELGHKALVEKKRDIVDVFGSSILDEFNNIDRTSLAKIVFSDENALKKLECISHKYIYDEVERIIKNRDETIIIEAALLYKIKLNTLCDLKIYIESKKKCIIERLKARGLNENEAKKLIKLQRDVKINKTGADIVVKNVKNYEELLVITKSIGQQYDREIRLATGRKKQIVFK